MAKASEIMTKPIVIKPSGKVVGIRGLYKSPSTGRLYVRFSFHGIDKQRTIYTEKSNFSELQREAERTLKELKREVKSMVFYVPNTGIKRKNAIEIGREQLQKLIRERWSLKGCTYGHIKRILTLCESFAVCETHKRADINIVDAHNKKAFEVMMSRTDVSKSTAKNNYSLVCNVYTTLILEGFHTGNNPALAFPKPTCAANRRTCELTLDEAARIFVEMERNDYEQKELILFYLLCVETGQRPKDIFRFDLHNLKKGHYLFFSSKTKRAQRVSHIISDRVLNLAQNIIETRENVTSYSHKETNSISGTSETFNSFWSISFVALEQRVRKLMKKYAPENVILYHCRHLFVSEIFRLTNSEFWAEVFTHDGANVNQRHYLHINQGKADEILIRFLTEFGTKVDAIKKFHSC